MEYQSLSEQQEGTGGSGDTGVMDPYGYIRDAESALLSGNRPDAIAFLALAYLAFDLVDVDCDDLTAPDMAWPERNS